MGLETDPSLLFLLACIILLNHDWHGFGGSVYIGKS